MNERDRSLPRAAASIAATPAGMTSRPMPSPAMTAIRNDDMQTPIECWGRPTCRLRADTRVRPYETPGGSTEVAQRRETRHARRLTRGADDGVGHDERGEAADAARVRGAGFRARGEREDR